MGVNLSSNLETGQHLCDKPKERGALKYKKQEQISLNKEGFDVNSSNQNILNVDPPVKRKRGRPRKNKDVPVVGEEKEKPVKRRGRPPASVKKQKESSRELSSNEKKESVKNILSSLKKIVVRLQKELAEKADEIEALDAQLKAVKKKPSKPDVIKNMVVNPDGSKDFNFCIRKPVLNCEELLSGNAWEKHLINKWVYTYNASEGRNIFYKHIMVDSRLLQVTYSGLDLLGDGVWILYKTRLYEKGDDFMVEPQEYMLKFGSFECEDYLQELLNHKFITEEEKQLLSTTSGREKLKQGLPMMNEGMVD